jgi:ribonucleoside-triphosphate reductase (formate)
MLSPDFSLIDRYVNKGLEDKNENANRSRSYSNMKSTIAEKAIAEYTMGKYPRDIRKLHDEGFIYIHDRSNGIIPYCHGGDLQVLLGKGLYTEYVVGGPAKHFSSALNQCVNYLCTSQQEFAGAQAFADFNTLLAPLVWKDKLTQDEVKQFVQQFIFDLNFPTRSGYETPFTNVIFNAVTPAIWADEPVVSPDMYMHVYGDFYKESMMILKAFNDVYSKGDYLGRPFTFPIPTINLVPGMDWDDPLWTEIFATEARLGTYSWMNYLGTGYKVGSKRSMCCRFSIDFDALSDSGGRWAIEGSTGSIGITTINLGKLGYISRDETQLFENLRHVLNKSLESLMLKTEWCQQKLDSGMLPLASEYGMNLDRFFKTIGYLGFDELFMNFTGRHYWENGNIPLAHKVMDFTREWAVDMQNLHQILINNEQTPGESSAGTLAKKDVGMYPDIYTLGTPDNPYYSTMLTPSSIEMDVVERIDREQDLLMKFTGGTVHRLFLGEASPDPGALQKLVHRIATFSTVPYFDVAATFSVCSDRDCKRNTTGIHGKCPVCGSVTRIYNRITGYYRDINGANESKKQEFRERTYVSV